MFEKIIGQALPKQILQTAVSSGKISHGYIFYGQKGIGKTSLAVEFAKSIVCEHKNACGECHHCKQFFSTSDIQIIECEKSISVSDIREITSEIYLKPFLFEKKIYLIKDAEKMTVQAQNALLKIFEEPPEYAVIILVTSNLSMILPTILSRGVAVRFQPLTPSQIQQYLQQQGITESSDSIINQANGSITAALELIHSESYRTLRDKVLKDFSLLLQNRGKKDVVRLYGDFISNEENAFKILDILNSLVYDSICTDASFASFASLKKNPDFSGSVSISVKTAYAIYQELGELSKRLSSNAAYGLSVLSALIHIRLHLAEK